MFNKAEKLIIKKYCFNAFVFSFMIFLEKLFKEISFFEIFLWNKK